MTPSLSVSRTWVPVTFVVVALVLLLGTPLVVSRRVRRLREDVVDVADQARLLVSEFEASFATELVVSLHAPAAGGAADSSRELAIATERAEERSLDSVAARLGVDAVERLVQLRTAEQRWRVASADGRPTRDSAQVRRERSADGREVLAAAESLQGYLYALSTQARERVRRLEQFDVVAAVALTPIALVALGIVVSLQRRMRAFATEADDRAAKLARSVELRATLIHGVVHDIKNPLGAASGYAELLDEGFAGSLNEQQLEMVRRMKRLVGTAQATAAELVDLARVDAGEYPIDRHEVNLASTVAGIVDDYRAEATRKSIQLTFETPSDTILAVTDAVRVRHIVENLLSNAIKYTPRDGRVRVVMAIEPSARDMVRIAVHDSGPGVPAEFRERIFDAFFRVPSSETVVPGSGLGLAISRRIARLLGGDVTMEPADGNGSVFSLLLPIESPPT